MTSFLEVRDLHVSYSSSEGLLHPAVAGVSFELLPREILGVIGESGSGKSTLGVSLVRLLPGNAKIIRGSVHFEGNDLLQAMPEELERIRGRRISLIFQEPSLALHPTMRAGKQVRQVLAAHNLLEKNVLNERTREVFAELFPEGTDRILSSYPHQLSGGQRQRVLIAQAIICGPSVVIADEPTASLDPATQMEILEVFRRLKEQLGLAMIFITHNPALLSGFADRVLVLYGGRVAELGPASTVLTSPRHPYTRALFDSIPKVFEEGRHEGQTKLPVIPGDSSLSLPMQGCSFEPRCTERMDICQKREPALVGLSEKHAVSCFKYGN
jgi:oligopeptide/dipeptide ABC transporter ATP-binding protein